MVIENVDLPDDEPIASFEVKTLDADISKGVEEKRLEERFRAGTPISPTENDLLLSTLARYWPNVTRACALSGISYGTYQNRMKSEPDFAAKVDAIKRVVLDDLEGLGLDYARTPRGFMHWIATLKAHRPERWDPTKQVIIKHELGPEQLRAKQENLARLHAIDAEVIEATGGPRPSLERATSLEIPDLPADIEETRASPAASPITQTGSDDVKKREPTEETLDGGGAIDFLFDEPYTSGVIDAPTIARPTKPSAQNNQVARRIKQDPPLKSISKHQKGSYKQSPSTDESL